MPDWAKLVDQGRAKAVGVSWNDAELKAVTEFKIPADYVRRGCLTVEQYRAMERQDIEGVPGAKPAAPPAGTVQEPPKPPAPPAPPAGKRVYKPEELVFPQLISRTTEELVEIARNLGIDAIPGAQRQDLISKIVEKRKELFPSDTNLEPKGREGQGS